MLSSSTPTPPTIDKTTPGTIDHHILKDGSPGPDFVWLPAGSFFMGSPDKEEGRNSDEGPQHLVTISKFAMGRTEVTVGQFSKFAKATDFVADPSCDWRDPPFGDKNFKQADDHPVVCVSWIDAQKYLTWLSEQTKHSGYTYESPSEAQQEYAIRAMKTSPPNAAQQTIYP